MPDRVKFTNFTNADGSKQAVALDKISFDSETKKLTMYSSIDGTIKEETTIPTTDVEVDDTLAIERKAADSKAAGDAIKDVIRIGGTPSEFTGMVISSTSEEVDLVEQSAFDAEIAKFNAKVGSPLVAATVSAMTDTAKIYVYTGSETGYTSGNWYYYNGSAWISGGVYNSVAIETDKTLTVENMAADAKKTGDEIDALKEDLSDIVQYQWADISSLYESGRINTGSVGSTVTPTRVSSTSFDSAICECRTGDVFKITGIGGDSGRLWCFCDTNYVVQSRADAYVTGTGLEVTAPKNGYFISNAGHDSHTLTKKTAEVIIPQRYEDYIGEIGYMPSNTYTDDLDDAKVGWLRYSNSADNIPDTASGFAVTVENGTAAKCQMAFTDELNIFIRFYASSAWGEWREIDDPAFKTNVSNNFNVILDRIGTMGYYAASASTTDLDSIKVGWTRYGSSAPHIPASGAGWVVNLHRASNSMCQLAITDSQRLFTRKLELGTWGNWIEFPNMSKLSSGENWSSDIIPDYGSTTEYSAISAVNPTLSELYSLYDALVTAYPNYISKTDLGVDQSGLYHIYKYSFVPETISLEGVGNFNLPNFPKILLGSGTHGNGQDAGDEPEMVIGVYYLMKNICTNWHGNDALTYLRHHVQIELIPVQNPWGYVNLSRRNSRGVDINRNFPFGWTQGTEGSTTYGGTEPFSEAESVIIRDFITANSDALFYLDLHATGGTQTQAHMIYYSMNQYSNLIVPANDTVVYLSDKWNHENIANLDTSIMHGYINRTSNNGSGSIYQWVCAVKGIPACVMEAFPNFEDSGLEDNSELVMRMCQEELVTFILKCIRYIKFNYLSNQR